MEYLGGDAARKTRFIGTKNGQGVTTYLIASLCESCKNSELVLDDE